MDEWKYEAARAALEALLAPGVGARGAVWVGLDGAWRLLVGHGLDQAELQAIGDPSAWSGLAGLFTWHDHAAAGGRVATIGVWSTVTCGSTAIDVERHRAVARLVALWPGETVPYVASLPRDEAQLTAVLAESEWNLALAARRLGVARATIYNRMRRLGIERLRRSSAARAEARP